MPVSISSNTSVRCDEDAGEDARATLFFPAEFAPASTLAFNASITRDNSPPDAICSSGRIASPALVAIR